MNAAYTDSFEHNFDAKGRITVPSEWRSDIHEKTLHIMKSKEGALAVWPESFLNARVASIQDTPLTDPKRLALEKIAGSTQTATIDPQGRIMVKEKFRTSANLDKKVILQGCSTHFKIWDHEKWSSQQSADILNYEEIL